MTGIQFSPDEIRTIAHRVADAGALLDEAEVKLVFPADQPGFSSPEAARSYAERLSTQLKTARNKLRDALDQLLPNLLWNQPVEPYEGNRGSDGMRVRRLVELTALGPGTLEPDLAEIASRVVPILRSRGFAPAAFGPITPMGFRELTTTDGTAEVTVASRTDLRVSIDVPVGRR